MGHSYTQCTIHYVFSTKERRNLISSDMEKRLWGYMGGIATQHQMIAHAIGGVENHVHLLLTIPTTMTISKAIQLIKGGSSKWINETFPTQQNFSWQEGYGAFSVSVTGIPRTTEYIHNQATHHQTISFEDEFIQFLNKHGLEYDPKHVFG